MGKHGQSVLFQAKGIINVMCFLVMGLLYLDVSVWGKIHVPMNLLTIHVGVEVLPIIGTLVESSSIAAGRSLQNNTAGVGAQVLKGLPALLLTAPHGT